MDNLYFKVAMAKIDTRRTNMPAVAVHGKKLGEPLNRRRRITVELPDFIIRAINVRVDEANQNEPNDEEVSFNDVVEWLLVCEVSLRRMPLLEANIPGFAAAMAVWLIDSNYQDADL
jgi:hypothetical protein